MSCDAVTLRTDIKDYSLVELRLVQLTNNDEQSFRLGDGLSVKLGRQVKSAQEKLLAAGGTLPTHVADMLSDREPCMPTVDTDNIDTDASQTNIDSPDASGGANVPSVCSQKSKKPNDIQYAWFKSKVVSRSHAEIWLRDGQLYLKDIGSSSGTFLNKIRLGTAGKMSRPYPLKNGDIIQLGVDYQGRTEEIYRAVEFRIEIDWMTAETPRRVPRRFRIALKNLLLATNPYASKTEPSTNNDSSVDCCICLSSIGPFQALFIAPCSHCFHYKCIRHVLKESLMFPCPVCRQVANLDASVSMESLFDADIDKQYDDTNDDAMIESIPNSPQTRQGEMIMQLDLEATPTAEQNDISS